MEELNNWLFNYSSHRQAWFAFKREHYLEYFNGDHTNVLKSKSQKTLEELILAHDGDIKKINEFVALTK